jgi:hypothetical protein
VEKNPTHNKINSLHPYPRMKSQIRTHQVSGAHWNPSGL